MVRKAFFHGTPRQIADQVRPDAEAGASLNLIADLAPPLIPADPKVTVHAQHETHEQSEGWPMGATRHCRRHSGLATPTVDGTIRLAPIELSRPPSWERIVGAARRRFSDRGVRRTTMSDVATESGVSRQLVYRVFANKRELIEAAAAERIGELADELTPDGWGVGLGADSFVAASVGVIRGIRLDAELRQLLGEDSPVSLHEVLWLDVVRARGVEFWLPWLKRARLSGLLRANVPDADLADWLQTVYASIILRRSLDEGAERSMITRFVLTSLSMTADGSAHVDLRIAE